MPEQLPDPIKELPDVGEFPAETIPPLRDRPPFNVPEGLTDRRDIEVKLTRSLSASNIKKIIAMASEDSAVATLLGDAFTPIGARRSPTKTGTETVATFYSYANQWAVEATIADDGAVLADMFRYQPCLTEKEFQRSVDVARSAVAGDLDGLDVGVMAIERAEPDDPYVGRRLADVRFFAPDERLARYFAIVDLATDKVLDAGSVADHHG